ncbi:MAG: Ornithine cyclodeaminase [uncultured Thermomicrobiales bacterium]|uniref:Ornithine cyclodeaminase n=1 Tax=uncultured Thermomicrobiales bacterium TaxID=1645740 RepID=A0A6J4TKK1_9BACT|nr:MAG: Ornithine cyclodeaminase [uncultured Thermomicrobiales bacterium]
MLALAREEVRALVPMPDAIALMKQVFAELSARRTQSPLRTVLHLGDGRDTLFMPASVPVMGALGLKIVSVFPANLERGLATINALVCLVSDETGEPVAIMDGTYLTALRTGAGCGAATDLLARPDSRTLVVFGSGAQGVTQAAAVCAVRPIERIVVVDPNRAALERYRAAIARDWPDLGDRIETREREDGAIADADVVCTATTSRTPVFDAAGVRPGTHVNAVGSYTPQMQELPSALVARSTVVVDAAEAAVAEAGDLIVPMTEGLVGLEHYQRELGMVVSGTVPGRTSSDELTLFKSVGNAVQDVVVARRAVERAIARGVGTEIRLG